MSANWLDTWQGDTTLAVVGGAGDAAEPAASPEASQASPVASQGPPKGRPWMAEVKGWPDAHRAFWAEAAERFESTGLDEKTSEALAYLLVAHGRIEAADGEPGEVSP